MSLSSDERHNLLLSLLGQYMLGELSQGQLLVYLREKVLGKNQTEFAKLTKVSRRTIINIENDDGPFTELVLNKVFRPFGIKSGLVPISANVARQLLGAGSDTNESTL